MGAIRPFQSLQDCSVLLAVLLVLPTCRTEAEPRQAAISANGRFHASDSIIRRAAKPPEPETIPENVRGRSISRHSPTDQAAAAQNERGARSSSTARDTDASLLSVGSASDAEKLPKWLGMPGIPEVPPTEYLLFNWDAGGNWNGERNDLNAEVGFEFTPEKDLNITAIGRHVAGSYTQRDEGGINLFETTNVTLWYVLPRGSHLKKNRTLDDLELLTVFVGPNDESEVGGKYRFHYLDKPFEIYAHQSYRITQTCREGMKDVWNDNVAFPWDIEEYSLTECVKVKEGVHSDSPHTFPENIEHLYKRAGMINLRLDAPDGCGMATPVNSKENTAGLFR